MKTTTLVAFFALAGPCQRLAVTQQPARAAPTMSQATIRRNAVTYVRWNLPDLARLVLARGAYAEKYDLFLDLNPYLLRGQFDEDSLIDLAIQVVEKKTGKRGIAIIHAADSSVHILGAGTPFGNGGDDFSWLWVWHAEARNARRAIPSVGREILLVEKPESAGGIIWWNGTEYVWTQYGD